LTKRKKGGFSSQEPGRKGERSIGNAKEGANMLALLKQKTGKLILIEIWDKQKTYLLVRDARVESTMRIDGKSIDTRGRV